MSMFGYSSAVCVDKGSIRANNEDNFYLNGKFLTENNRDYSDTFTAFSVESTQIYGVFDGMGGEALGEEASYIAAHTVSKAHKHVSVSGSDMENAILHAIEESNTKICKKMLESGEKRIGSTFSAVGIRNDTATVYNVGDSRVYLLRDTVLKQISVDDTTAQRLVQLGMITPEEAKTHKDRHKLTQHLGIFRDEMTVEPHISESIPLKKNDKILICSDGLTDMLTDAEIYSILSKNKSSEILSRELLTAALNNGGMDNVTVLVIRVGANRPQSAKRNVKASLAVSALLIILSAAIAVLAVGKRASNEKVPEKITATNIYFANPVTEIPLGTENTFLAAVEPPKADGKVVFSSSDESVIEIDEKTGFYKALHQGSAVITASNGDVRCNLNVSVFVPISKIDAPEQISMHTGDTELLQYTVEPTDADVKASFWIDNESVAVISANGIIKAEKSGVANIIITAGDCQKLIVLKVTDKESRPFPSSSQNSNVKQDGTTRPDTANDAAAAPDAELSEATVDTEESALDSIVSDESDETDVKPQETPADSVLSDEVLSKIISAFQESDGYSANVRFQ